MKLYGGERAGQAFQTCMRRVIQPGIKIKRIQCKNQICCTCSENMKIYGECDFGDIIKLIWIHLTKICCCADDSDNAVDHSAFTSKHLMNIQL